MRGIRTTWTWTPGIHPLQHLLPLTLLPLPPLLRLVLPLRLLPSLSTLLSLRPLKPLSSTTHSRITRTRGSLEPPCRFSVRRTSRLRGLLLVLLVCFRSGSTQLPRPTGGRMPSHALPRPRPTPPTTLLCPHMAMLPSPFPHTHNRPTLLAFLTMHNLPRATCNSNTIALTSIISTSSSTTITNSRSSIFIVISSSSSSSSTTTQINSRMQQQQQLLRTFLTARLPLRLLAPPVIRNWWTPPWSSGSPAGTAGRQDSSLF